MRHIHIGRRGSETANEEQPHKWRKTERFQQEAPSASASSDPPVALAYPATGETQDRPGSVLVQKSGHVGDNEQISVLDAISYYEMDGRKSRYIGEVLDWYRGEDAGDLKRSGLNELTENFDMCQRPRGKFMKISPKILMDEKIWRTWKSNQKVVMDEKINPKIQSREDGSSFS